MWHLYFFVEKKDQTISDNHYTVKGLEKKEWSEFYESNFSGQTILHFLGVTNMVVPDTLFCAQVNLNVSCGSVFAAQSEFICLGL